MLDSSLFSIKKIGNRYHLVQRLYKDHPRYYRTITSNIDELPVKKLYFEICSGIIQTDEEINTIWRNTYDRSI